MKGRLYLLPCHLGDNKPDKSAVQILPDLIMHLDYFIVENVKTARRWLKSLNRDIDIDKLTFFELNKHTEAFEISGFLKPCDAGHDVGLLSEAGSPAIADPGADVVAIAHSRKIKVTPIPGPSSILLALISSGMSGQNFAFTGYLPKERNERIRRIQELDGICSRQTQIFMETPFRTHHLLEDLLSTCNDKTSLCIATDITLESEQIKTQTIGEWKKNLPSLKKKLCVFVLGKPRT